MQQGMIKNNSGLSIIATVLVLLALGLFAAVAVSLVTTSGGIGIQEERGTEAFYIAEGGVEYILANRTVPNYSTQGTSTPLGSGNFVVSTLTYLTGAVAIGNTIINVDSTTGFPTPSGKIVVDSEIMSYTATTATSFTVTAPGAKEAHASGNAVYPATSVSVDPGAGGTTIAVASTTGFVMPGVIRIDNEYIYCASANSPLTTQFINCTRGYKGTTASAHAAGSNVFQYIVRSTGTTALDILSGPAQRIVEKTVPGVSVKQGTLIKTTAGAPVSQSVTGIGFKPNAVIFFWTRQVAEGFSNGDNPNANNNFGLGFATGPSNERAVSVTALDGVNNSDDGRRRSDNKMIIFLTSGGPPNNPVAEAELTSFDADGFSINWTTNNARAYIIHYIALGGDITDAFAGTFNLTNGAGNDSVNTLAFQPDFVMFLWSFTEAVNTNTANAEIGIGFAQSPTARGAMVYAARDNTPSNNSKRWQQRTDSVILILNPAANPPNQDAVADFVSMDANGFTVSKSNPPAANVPIFYLALKGGAHKVGSFNQPAATGNQTQTGVGFRPQELMLLSRNLVTSLTIDGGVGPEVSGAISLGAAQTSTARGSAWFQDRNVDNPTNDANMYTSTTNALTLASGPATVNARADLVSFNENGFTLGWTVNEGTAREILYWAIGPNPKASNILWREVFR